MGSSPRAVHLQPLRISADLTALRLSPVERIKAQTIRDADYPNTLARDLVCMSINLPAWHSPTMRRAPLQRCAADDELSRSLSAILAP